MSKYNYNKDFFQCIDSVDKAYWLGFLYADGCITRFYKNEKLKSMSLEITLCHLDYNHLVKFNQSLNSNVPIRDRRITLRDKDYLEHRLVINCTKMCYDLINLGCTPNKTFNIEIPSNDIVPQKYMRDFLRGFFDGDGCLHSRLQGKTNTMEVTLTGTELMLKSIIDYLISNHIILLNPKLHYDTRSKACSFFLYGNMAKDFLDYIYKDSSIYLDRKYEKYVCFYKDYKLEDYHGVYWSKHNNAYIVTIYINGVRHRIGQSKDLSEAIKMRKQAEYEKMKIINSPLSS